ncbi:MAG: LysR family transcriptional regulator [Lachnospiraceae bacterium]|nr:LysR family transcriptional regulator [Lachnospiraceae bacterium]
MNDKQLKSLITIVECGSFAKAEEELFLSRQALKKQIDALEEELGFILLLRTHHGVALTPAGEEFCRHAKEIITSTDAVIKRCRDMTVREDTIRIASPYHYRLLLEDAFAEFHRKFPSIKQQVILESPSNALDSILNGEVDVAEYIYRPVLEDMDLRFMKIFELPYRCLVAPSHPFAKKRQLTLDDLKEKNIYIHRGENNLIVEMSQYGDGSGISFETIGNDVQQITNICYNGGVFISKAYFLNAMEPLIPVPLSTDHIPEAVILYSKTPSANTKKFIDIIRELYL